MREKPNHNDRRQYSNPMSRKKEANEKRFSTEKTVLERWRKNTRRLKEVDINPILKEATINEGKFNLKENKNNKQTNLVSAALETTQQKARLAYRTDPQNMKLDKWVKLFNRYCLQMRRTFNTWSDWFWTKQAESGMIENHWTKSIVLEKECGFAAFSDQLLSSTFTISTNENNLQNRVEKEDLTSLSENSGIKSTEHCR